MANPIVYQNVHGVDEFFVEYVPESTSPDQLSDAAASHPPREAVRSSIPAFASTVQKTKQWIAELMTEMQWPSAAKSYHGLQAVLHALRDRLTVNEATDFAAQLPMLIRGMYYEGWRPSRVPIKDRTQEEFLNHIFKAFPNDQSVDPEELTRAVMRVVRRHVTAGEMDDIEASLPRQLRQLLGDS